MKEAIAIVSTKDHDFGESTMYIISEGEVYTYSLRVYDIVYHRFWDTGKYGVDFQLAQIMNEVYGINIPTLEERLHEDWDSLEAHFISWFIPRKYKVSKLIIDTKEYSLETMKEIPNRGRIQFGETLTECLDNVSKLGELLENISGELDVDSDVVRAIYDRALISHGEMGYYEAIRKLFLTSSEALEVEAEEHRQKYKTKN